jgi:cytoskeletal protein CcmA (bactofilin family)
MFGRKKTELEENKPVMSSSDDLGIPAKPPAKAALTAAPKPVAGPVGRPAGELPRSGLDYVRRSDPAQPAVPAAAGAASGNAGAVRAQPETESRKLIVGREISLSGEIKSCDQLVVEGSVEANLANCRDIQIAESGLFKGSASIDDAEIRGRFEGALTVRNRLLIRATGQVTGTIRYGRIEIECGGRISGDVEVQSAVEIEVERLSADIPKGPAKGSYAFGNHESEPLFPSASLGGAGRLPLEGAGDEREFSRGIAGETGDQG